MMVVWFFDQNNWHMNDNHEGFDWKLCLVQTGRPSNEPISFFMFLRCAKVNQKLPLHKKRKNHDHQEIVLTKCTGSWVQISKMLAHVCSPAKICQNGHMLCVWTTLWKCPELWWELMMTEHDEPLDLCWSHVSFSAVKSFLMSLVCKSKTCLQLSISARKTGWREAKKSCRQKTFQRTERKWEAPSGSECHFQDRFFFCLLFHLLPNQSRQSGRPMIAPQWLVLSALR